LKITNYLQIKATNVFLTIVFKTSLLPYLRLATACMKRDTLIEHKEAIIVCEESGPISLSCNVLLTTPKANTIAKPIVPIVIAKSTSTYTNYGKINHTFKTYHNKKRKELLVVPITMIKSTELIVETKTQPPKLVRILIRYPCIICFNVEKSRKCPKKNKI
jgi:hypothetical protein